MKAGFIQVNTMQFSQLSLSRPGWHGRPLYITSWYAIIILSNLQNPRPDPHTLQTSHCKHHTTSDNTRTEEPLRYSTMAEAFLNQLFAAENEDTECPVCHEIYGTLGDRGETERKMSLQCGHTIGSMCAHRWFTSTNTVSNLLRPPVPAFLLI